MSSSRFALRLPFIVLASIVVGSCGDDETPRASVRVTALATEPTTLDGPHGSALVVPAGATDEDVTIVLTAPRGRRPTPNGAIPVSGQFVLTPEGKTFLEPLELTIPITPTALPSGATIDDVIVLRAPQGTGGDAFVPLPTRRRGNAVVATTEHFSDFIAVVIAPGAAPFGACGDEVCGANEGCDACPYDCGVCLPSSDTTPPTVVGLEAPAPLTDVRGDAIVAVRFDEDILPSSVSALSVALTNGASQPVAGIATVTGSLVEFTPAAPLVSASSYTLTVDGVRDLAGNLLVTPYTNGFVTANGAKLSSSSPMPGAVGVAQDAIVTMVLEGMVVPATLAMQPVGGACTGSVQLSDDGFASCLGGALSVESGDSNLTIQPAHPFVGSRTIAIRFTTATRDVLGFSLAGSSDFSFSTAVDATGPTLVSSVPTNDAQDVLPTTPIVFTFSERVDPTTVDATTVRLTQESIQIAAQLTVVDTVVTLVPDAPLALDTQYSLSIIGVDDYSANGISPTFLSFRTIAPPSVASSRFPDFAVGVHPRADLDLTFDRPIDSATLTMQATDSATCSGTLQLSDGTTCYGGAIEVVSPTQVVVRASTSLPTLASMTIAITSAATDTLGIGFAGNVERHFRVSPINGFAYAITFGPYTDGAMSGGVGATAMERADSLCDPGGTGAAKALLITSARYPCLVAWCGLDTTPSVSSMDWVLQTDTTYLNADGDAIFTTSAIAPINPPPGDLATMFANTGVNFHFGGDGTWIQHPSDYDCADFSSNLGTDTSAVGWSSSSTSGWIVGGLVACSAQLPITCVAQPPAIPHPTH